MGKFGGVGSSTVLTDLQVDGTTVTVDTTNDRLGVGTAAPGTQIQVESTAPYITLKNSTAENTAAGCESRIIFEDHGNNSLGLVEVSHVGTSDDEKGQMIFKTNNDTALQTALTISEAQLATFAGGVTVTGTLTVDSVGVTAIQKSDESFVDNNTSLMTSAAIDDRINTAVTAEDLDVAADSGTAAVDLNSQSLTVTGGTGVTTSATGQAVTVNVDVASPITSVTGDFTVTGGDVTVGTAGNTTATTIGTIVNTGTNVGKSLTVSAGSSTTGGNNINGGDLVLKAGGGDGTGTSAMTFSTKVNGTDTVVERMRIHTNGAIGIGVNDPDTTLEILNSGTQLKLSYDASNSTTFDVSSAGVLTVAPSGGVVGISGMLANKHYIISTKANGATITAAESGGLIIQSTSDATTSNVVITLPATVTGLIYTFVYYGAAGQGFQISPNANDKIAGSTINHSGNAVTAAGSGGDAGRGVDDKDLILTASGSKVGDRVTLLGDGSGGWAILDGFGNWAFEA